MKISTNIFFVALSLTSSWSLGITIDTDTTWYYPGDQSDKIDVISDAKFELFVGIYDTVDVSDQSSVLIDGAVVGSVELHDQAQLFQHRGDIDSLTIFNNSKMTSGYSSIGTVNAYDSSMLNIDSNIVENLKTFNESLLTSEGTHFDIVNAYNSSGLKIDSGFVININIFDDASLKATDTYMTEISSVHNDGNVYIENVIAESLSLHDNAQLSVKRSQVSLHGYDNASIHIEDNTVISESSFHGSSIADIQDSHVSLMSLYDDSILNLHQIEQSLTGSSIFAYDDSMINIDGGNYDAIVLNSSSGISISNLDYMNVLIAEDSTSIDISNGAYSDLFFSDNSVADIHYLDKVDNIFARDKATLTIEDGLYDTLNVSGSSIVNIEKVSDLNKILIADNAVINLYGSEFNIEYGSVSGKWMDGTEFSMNIFDPYALYVNENLVFHEVHVVESPTLVLLLLGVAGVGINRRRLV